MAEAKAYIKTNYIEDKKLMPVIFGATGGSMAIMFVLISLDANILLTTAVFLVMVFVFIFSFSYTARFWLYEDKLEEKLTPKIPFSPFVKARSATYYWTDLESYLIDSTLTRSSGERQYIKLYFENPKRVVAINEGMDAGTRKQFEEFINEFKTLLNGESKPLVVETGTRDSVSPSPPVTETEALPIRPVIHARARKNFYQSTGGKILAIGFLTITIGFVFMYFFNEQMGLPAIKGTNSWKIWAVMLPGSLFLMNKSFGVSSKV